MMPFPLHGVTVYTTVLAGALIAAIWQSALLTMCVALALRLTPGVPARTRSIVWTATLLLVVSSPLLPAIGHTSGPAAEPQTPIRIGASWALGLVVFWAMLSLIRAAQLVRSAILLRRIARTATPLKLNVDLSNLLPANHQSSRIAQLCQSNEVAVPSVAGFLKPRILLPEGLLEAVPAHELRQIVLHEMEHLRRHDDWTNLLQKLSLVLFPLNPAVLWIERRLCAERELACDDAVMRSTGARKAYASTLAHLAERALGHRGLSLALGAFERRTELARRIHRILGTPEREMPSRRVAVLAATLLTSLSGAAIALHGTPQLIRFGPPPTIAEASTVMPPSANRPVAAHATQPAAQPMPRPVNVKMTVPVKRTQRVRTNLVSERPVQTAPWVVLTRWHDAEPGSHLTLTVTADSQFSYAAVPTRNGWLIFQL